MKVFFKSLIQILRITSLSECRQVVLGLASCYHKQILIKFRHYKREDSRLAKLFYFLLFIVLAFVFFPCRQNRQPLIPPYDCAWNPAAALVRKFIIKSLKQAPQRYGALYDTSTNSAKLFFYKSIYITNNSLLGAELVVY